jgi:hypothetical protein
MQNTFKTLSYNCPAPLRVNNDGSGSCVIDGLNEREREREREIERLQLEMPKVQQTILGYLGSFHTCLLNN